MGRDEVGDLTAREFLELVAGERCPCGHSAEDHDPPSGPEESWGRCNKVCACMGVLDARPDDDSRLP